MSINHPVPLMATALAVLAALTACANGPVPQPAATGPQTVGACSVEILALPGEAPSAARKFFVEDIDPTGRFIVGWLPPHEPPLTGVRLDQPFALLWDNGVARPLGEPGIGTDARGVNELGWVVGNGTTVVRLGSSEEERFAWVYTGDAEGKVHRLPTPEGYESAQANAINKRGVVAGTAHGTAPTRDAAVVWTPDADGRYAVRILPAPEGIGVRATDGAHAYDIADDGTIVGSVEAVPFVWPSDGPGHQLPVPEAPVAVPTDPLTRAYGSVNKVAGEWAVGFASPQSDLVRWNLRTGEMSDMDTGIDHYPGVFGVTAAVSEQGDVAYSGADGPVLVRDGRPLQLPVHPAVGDGSGQPWAISADGRVVLGTMSTGVDDIVGVVWRC